MVALLADHGPAAGDDDFGKMVVKGHTVLHETDRRVAVNDERGEGRDMQQPPLRGHVVVAVAATDADVRHFQIRDEIPVHRCVLRHCRRCQQETAGRPPLDVALRESRGIGEAPVVEDVEGIQVERLDVEQTGSQLQAPHPLVVVPPREIVGFLIDDVPAEALAVGVDVQFVVVVTSHQFGRIQRQAERNAQITQTETERRLAVGIHFRGEVLPTVIALGHNIRSGKVEPCLGSPLRLWPNDISGINVTFVVFFSQYIVEALQKVLRRHRLPQAARRHEEQPPCPTPACQPCRPGQNVE